MLVLKAVVIVTNIVAGFIHLQYYCWCDYFSMKRIVLVYYTLGLICVAVSIIFYQLNEHVTSQIITDDQIFVMP